MKSCQIGAMTTILVLRALALELACVPVGRRVAEGPAVVGGVVWLPRDPVVEAVDEGKGPGDVALDDGLTWTVSEVKPLEPERAITVDDGAALTLEDRDKPELCEAEDNGAED